MESGGNELIKEVVIDPDGVGDDMSNIGIYDCMKNKRAFIGILKTYRNLF